MKLMKKLVKNEDGQVLVLVALLMVVLIGFAALLIDVGMMYLTKANMQNAADAAAIAGAQKLPDDDSAIRTAMDFAGKNGLKATVNSVNQDGDTVTVTPGYSGDSTKIEVICTRTVPFSFAKVLGFIQSDVTARAVAKRVPVWNGEALPFINLDNNYITNPKIVAWEKTAPGNFESLWSGNNPPSEYQMFNQSDPTNTYFTIDYKNGITVTNGTVADIKQEVGYIYAQHKPVYIFSLRYNVIEDYATGLKNKENIRLEDLVLLQVTFDSYDGTGKTLFLTTTKVYDIKNGVYPTEFLNADSKGTSGLVE